MAFAKRAVLPETVTLPTSPPRTPVNEVTVTVAVSLPLYSLEAAVIVTAVMEALEIVSLTELELGAL